ncbi:MAG: MaoC family dehydratase N-terminal domain-containing protein [Gammaproteobacteria bacterium]
MEEADLNHLQSWVGRREEAVDVVSAARVAALAATLDHPSPWPQAGAPLPPLWHWTLCAPIARQSALGPDGHPQRGGFLPPVPLPRRLWAGGRVEFHRPLRVGEAVRRVSRVSSVAQKRGGSGDLVFVTVEHQYHGAGDGEPAIREEHDIVYRERPKPGDGAGRPVQPPGEFAWRREVRPDAVLLFRYSALTFNGHRIHYDRAYATGEEGYPGLVVHGPLVATLLVDLLLEQVPSVDLARFEFRAHRPLFDIGPFYLFGRAPDRTGRVALWACDEGGALAMEATATLA